MATSSFNVSCGAACATTRVRWAGSSAARSNVPWLPPIRTAPIESDGRGGYRWNPDVYRALKWLFETAIGGVAAQTVPQVASGVTAAQEELVNAITYAQQVATYAEGVAARTDATVEVVTNNGLTGTTSIPPSPEPPPRYSGGNVVA